MNKLISITALVLAMTACGSDYKKEPVPNNVTMPAIFNNGAAWTAGFVGGPTDCPIVWPARFDFEITGEGVLLSHGERMEAVGETSWESKNGDVTTTFTLLDNAINVKVECKL